MRAKRPRSNGNRGEMTKDKREKGRNNSGGERDSGRNDPVPLYYIICIVLYEIAQFPSQGQNQWKYQSRKMSQNLGTKYSGKTRFNSNEKLTLQTVSLTSSNWKIMPVRKHHTKDTDGRESVSIAYLRKLTCKSILSATLISFEFAILGQFGFQCGKTILFYGSGKMRTS